MLSLPAALDLESLGKPLYATAAEYQRAQSNAAEAAGLKAGDLIVAIDGQKIDSFADIQSIVSVSADEALSIDVQRDDSIVHLVATPRSEITSTLLGKRMAPRLGIEASNDPKDLRVERLGLGRAVVLGSYQTWQIVDRTSTFLRRLFSGRENADQVSGPIGIAAISGEMAKVGFGTLLNWAAILSASIGFFNLLPIPLLDGGHLLYFLIEAARGRPLSVRAQELGFRMGLAIVGLLMVFATSNDLLRVVPSLTKFLGITG
jgi:regulator of sigma E protease